MLNFFFFFFLYLSKRDIPNLKRFMLNSNYYVLESQYLHAVCHTVIGFISPCNVKINVLSPALQRKKEGL